MRKVNNLVSNWLKTRDNCFVAEYDVEDAPGKFMTTNRLQICRGNSDLNLDTTELPYCGFIDEPEWPKRNGRTRYYSECYRMPWFNDRATKYYKNNINLNLLCSTKNVTGKLLQCFRALSDSVRILARGNGKAWVRNRT